MAHKPTPEEFTATVVKAAIRTAKTNLAAADSTHILTAQEQQILHLGVLTGATAMIVELAAAGVIEPGRWS